jgi:hypoxanthine phosphoribosyltransferase
MEKLVRLNDKSFRLYKSENEVLNTVKNIAHLINDDYIGKRPLLVPVLNGSFLFAADLLKELKLDCEITFISTHSYNGLHPNGKTNQITGLNASITGRHVIIVEDIVDSGFTLASILPAIAKLNPASVKVASLFFKPYALQTEVQIDYVGMEITNEFIVGYGLDYEGLGRNLRDIYQVVEEE